MRLSKRTIVTMVAGALLALAGALGSGGLLHAADPDDDDADPTGERARVAAAALAKAVERGKALWSSKDLGKKSCASCHEDPEKPNIDLSTRKWSYPAYSRRKRAVLTLQQKVNEMIQYNARGKPLDLDSSDAAALAAYCMSLCKR